MNKYSQSEYNLFMKSFMNKYSQSEYNLVHKTIHE